MKTKLTELGVARLKPPNPAASRSGITPCLRSVYA